MSRAWLIEVVPADADPDDAAGTPIYHSDPIGSFPDDTRDLELISANLMEDESSSLPDFEVDILIMVTVGSIEVEHDDGPTRLDAPAAYPVSSSATLTNTGNSPAVYSVAKIGPTVGDAAPVSTDEVETGDAAAADEEDDDTAVEEDVDDSLIDTDADGLPDKLEQVSGWPDDTPRGANLGGNVSVRRRLEASQRGSAP